MQKLFDCHKIKMYHSQVLFHVPSTYSLQFTSLFFIDFLKSRLC